ncbi:unnamed protein product, partial [Staurois parvus]
MYKVVVMICTVLLTHVRVVKFYFGFKNCFTLRREGVNDCCC